jgi:hypothetical protein
LLVLLGCAPTTVTRLVEVPGPIQYRQLPAELLTDCHMLIVAPETNGELLQQWNALQSTVTECNSKIEAIRKLNEVETND